jgi:TRAP-type mannitol/chloroaromatic compound transport system permease small subunit
VLQRQIRSAAGYAGRSTGFCAETAWGIVLVSNPSSFATKGCEVPLRARLGAIADRIDKVNTAVGQAVTWCCLAMVIAQVAVVLLRYVLGLGSIWLQESIIYLHAALFLLAAAWTLRRGGHVRVDIFYAAARPRRKALVDLLGAIVFLLPFVTMLIGLSMPYVARSWAILERSRETSGLPLVFLLKTLIPAFALLLGLQGVSQAIRSALVLVADDRR